MCVCALVGKGIDILNSPNGCDSVLKYVDANMAQAFMVVVTYGSELPQYSDTHHCQSVFPEQSWNSVVGEDAGSGGGGGGGGGVKK